MELCLNCNEEAEFKDSTLYIKRKSKKFRLVHQKCAEKKFEEEIKIILASTLPNQEPCLKCQSYSLSTFNSYIVSTQDKKILKICLKCQQNYDTVSYKIHIDKQCKIIGIDQIGKGPHLFETETHYTQHLFQKDKSYE